MGSINAAITYRDKGKVHQANGQRLIFSPNRCFSMIDDAEDRQALNALTQFLLSKPELAIAGTGEFAEYLLKHAPALKNHVRVIIENESKANHLYFADRDGYPEGVCFRGPNGRAVYQQLENYAQS